MKKPATNAERQRAHRQRIRDRLAGACPPSPPPKGEKKRSRPARLEALKRELQDLLEGYQAWLDALPENQGDSELAERLRDTIERLQEALDALEQIDPPRGFGR